MGEIGGNCADDKRFVFSAAVLSQSERRTLPENCRCRGCEGVRLIVEQYPAQQLHRRLGPLDALNDDP